MGRSFWRPILLGITLVGCTGNGGPTIDPIMTPPPPEPTVSAEVGPLVDQAKADLANKRSANVKAIRLVRTEQHVWGDTSLGCPEPGQFYLQVLTPGWIIVLEYQGTTVEYHAGRGRVVSC